jgi:hypothetical protein
MPPPKRSKLDKMWRKWYFLLKKLMGYFVTKPFLPHTFFKSANHFQFVISNMTYLKKTIQITEGHFRFYSKEKIISQKNGSKYRSLVFF